MICSKCNKELNLQDVKNSKWVNDTQVFTVLCPRCENQNVINVNLFEKSHLSSLYIKLLCQDSSYCKQNTEKHLDYIENSKKNKILKHISECSTCYDKLEQLRLSEVCQNTASNQQLYDFFIKNAKDVIIELKKNQVKKQNENICEFSYKNDIFCLGKIVNEEKNTISNKQINKFCYRIESENVTIGLASFIISNSKIVLEKLWLKDKKAIKKEQRLINDIKNSKILIRLATLSKLCNASFL